MTNPWLDYVPGRSREEDLALLAAGYETGSSDDNGVPAPCPRTSSTPTAAGTPAASEEEPLPPTPENPPSKSPAHHHTTKDQPKYTTPEGLDLAVAQ